MRKKKFSLSDVAKATGLEYGFDKRTLSKALDTLAKQGKLEKLKNGEKDESIMMIQNYYNKNKGDKFDFNFMSEDDILNFAQLWSEVHDDEVMQALYERYLRSNY